MNYVKKYDITPVPKPRMTQRDRWKGRKCVTEYHAFKDNARLLGINLEEDGQHITFVIPFPKSYSLKKRRKLDGQPHRQRPDVDNLLKALMDAVFDEDSSVHDVRISKVWGHTGAIIVENIQ